jgi:hypothetical protein
MRKPETWLLDMGNITDDEIERLLWLARRLADCTTYSEEDDDNDAANDAALCMNQYIEDAREILARVL